MHTDSLCTHTHTHTHTHGASAINSFVLAHQWLVMASIIPTLVCAARLLCLPAFAQAVPRRVVCRS